MSKPLIEKTSIKRINERSVHQVDDFVAAEEPLEIRLEFGEISNRHQKNISVTMRTPGNDFELSLGFLYTEGIIESFEDIHSIKYCLQAESSNENIVKVYLKEGIQPDLQGLERNFYSNSSCGICGKSSIESIKITRQKTESKSITTDSSIIYSLIETVRKQQTVFELTGGLHASSLFSIDGDFLFLREDIGRHNALDKLIGYAFTNNLLPLDNHILFLSGRISFELIQKSVMAGIKIIVAVGAPSSLAVSLAKEFDITLIGFLKKDRFNIYSGDKRISISDNG